MTLPATVVVCLAAILSVLFVYYHNLVLVSGEVLYESVNADGRCVAVSGF